MSEERTWGVSVGYRCEAKTAAGFVQQFGCCYVLHGYHYYVVGQVPEGKCPERIDERIVDRYELDVSRFVRARRKKAGRANVQYIRFKRFFVLCSTGPVGAHRFFEEHPPREVKTRSGRTKLVPQIRNIREQPLGFAGYSIGWHRGHDRKWHVSIRIHPERYKNIKAHFVDIATKRSVSELTEEFQRLPFEPYAPIRSQCISLLAAVNREREKRGWTPVPFEALRLRRRIVRPFGFDDEVFEQKEDAA